MGANSSCGGSNSPNLPKYNTVKGDNNNSGNLNNTNRSTINNNSLNLNDCSYSGQGSTSNPFSGNYKTLGNIYSSGNLQVNNLTVNKNCNLIPRGIIIMWNSTQIPNGWTLCDGTNCTPDLRGRFILGYDNKQGLCKIGQTGGEENHLLTIGEIPSHSHTYNINNNASSFLTGASGAGASSANATNTSGINDFTYLNSSTNSAHNNMPPFYVLTYIMKL
jgi:microcystin-dependent protein